MRSRMIQGLAVAGMMSLLSGCAFTQWTDHAFIGSPNDPPTHAHRETLGAFVLPLAVLGDILTAPGQFVAILVMGDGGMYKRPNGRASVVLEMPTGGRDSALASLDPALSAEPASNIEPGKVAGLRVWGVDADHRLTELALTPLQQAELAGRLDILNALPEKAGA